ncbi:glycosyltransferase family A protein [Flavobacteriaceae sp. LMIT009]
MTEVTIIITTRNRLKELKYTLERISYLLQRNDTSCIICDDASEDDSFNFIKANYPEIKLIKNETLKGLIYSRNRMMNLVKTEYIISIDDDLNFISEYPTEKIFEYFKSNDKCAVVSFRIFWSKLPPVSHGTEEKPCRMKSYAGGAHAFRMSAWKSIPNYPDWFVFYGEENFASFQLFKKGWEIHYLPEILVHHRVDLKGRKKNKDYKLRLRRSLRSGWYLYFLFFPHVMIPKRFLYTLWIQLKTKVFRGDIRALFAIIQALGDVVVNLPRLFKYSNRLSVEEYSEYSKLPETKLYWHPINVNTFENKSL